MKSLRHPIGLPAPESAASNAQSVIGCQAKDPRVAQDFGHVSGPGFARDAGTIRAMITRRSSPFPGALAVTFGGLLLAAALNAGAAVRTAPLPGPAVILTVGDRSKPSELIHLLNSLANYDLLTAARYVAEADAAHRGGITPVVRIPMPSAAAAAAVVVAVPRAGATATVEPAAPEP
jgi:hypothetical protein